MEINYVRVDYENTNHLMTYYGLYPIECDDEEVLDFISQFIFPEYEEAASMAMDLVKDPQSVIERGASTKGDTSELMVKLKGLIGYHLTEGLFIIDSEKHFEDCPPEYLYDVGEVYKTLADRQIDTLRQ